MDKCCERYTIDTWIRPDTKLGRTREFHETDCPVFITQVREALVGWGKTGATEEDAKGYIARTLAAEEGAEAGLEKTAKLS